MGDDRKLFDKDLRAFYIGNIDVVQGLYSREQM